MTQKLAILGAGPIGLEAALLAASLGWDVDVYEAGRVAEHVRRWGHVTFFSPWSLNRSANGVRHLTARGIALEPEDAFPTGLEFVEKYLDHLASDPLLDDRIHTQTRVLGVSRRGAFKGDFIGDPQRQQRDFLILVQDAQGERYVTADVVLDTTGAYEQPNALGQGGLPALGEGQSEDFIERFIPDVLGADRATYANKSVLVVGSGYSAVTSVASLLELRKTAPLTQVIWASKTTQELYALLANDPLPQRAELAALGNEAASGEVVGVKPIRGAVVRRLNPTSEGVEVTLATNSIDRTVRVDRVISNIGYKPDTSIYRELQVHLCYASEGPMKLAAALLSAGGGGGDCLAQTGQGVETLFTPEPNFFVLGAKSYGRNSAFLLKIGMEQIVDLFEHLQSDEVSAAE